MDAAFYEKIIIENPDFPILVLENEKTGSPRQQLCPVCAHPQAYFEIRKENY